MSYYMDGTLIYAARYEYEDDCAFCEEGVIQWTDIDEIAVCDCCGLEIDLNEMEQDHYDSCYNN